MDESVKKELVKEFLEYHGDSLPDPEHYPRIFATLVRHFMYTKTLEKEKS